MSSLTSTCVRVLPPLPQSALTVIVSPALATIGCVYYDNLQVLVCRNCQRLVPSTGATRDRNSRPTPSYEGSTCIEKPQSISIKLASFYRRNSDAGLSSALYGMLEVWRCGSSGTTMPTLYRSKLDMRFCISFHILRANVRLE
jgi:hypothetical protein